MTQTNCHLPQGFVQEEKRPQTAEKLSKTYMRPFLCIPKTLDLAL